MLVMTSGVGCFNSSVCRWMDVMPAGVPMPCMTLCKRVKGQGLRWSNSGFVMFLPDKSG